MIKVGRLKPKVTIFCVSTAYEKESSKQSKNFSLCEDKRSES